MMACKETATEIVVEMEDEKVVSLPEISSSNTTSDHDPALVDADSTRKELPNGIGLVRQSAEDEIGNTEVASSESSETESKTHEQSDPQTDPQADLRTDSVTQPPQVLQTPPQTEPPPNPHTDRSMDSPDSHGEPNETKQKRSRATFNNAVDLPDENANNLTSEQITSLIQEGPSVRKKYEAYFNRSGSVRHEYQHLVLAKTPSGEFSFPEAIIKSNIHKWRGPPGPSDSSPSTPYGTGRKQATRKTSVKRAASETSDVKSPLKKRAKTLDRNDRTSKDRKSKGAPSGGILDRDQSDEDDNPNRTRNDGRPNRKSRNRSAGITKSAQKAGRNDDAAATVVGVLLNNEVSKWFKEHEDDDLDLLGDSELLQFMLWLDSHLRTMQYSLVGALHVDKDKHKETLGEVLKGLNQLQIICTKLADHLKTEIGDIKGK